MKKILFLLPLFSIPVFAETPPAIPQYQVGTSSHVQSTINALVPGGKPDVPITSYMPCRDFIADEIADNQPVGTPEARSGAIVHQHLGELHQLIAPYLVTDSHGTIFKPTLEYLMVNISGYCQKNPGNTLNDAIKVSASKLSQVIKDSNNETRKDWEKLHQQ